MTVEIPRPQRATQDAFVRAQREMPLAWPDDTIILAAELNPSNARVVARARRYVRDGHVPQLRMLLADGDTVRDYMAALDNPQFMRQIRQRSAVAVWNAGGALWGPKPGGRKWRCPDRPYLRAMLAATYDDAQPYDEPPPTPDQLLLGDVVDDGHDQADRPEREYDSDRAHTPMRGPGRQ